VLRIRHAVRRARRVRPSARKHHRTVRTPVSVESRLPALAFLQRRPLRGLFDVPGGSVLCPRRLVCWIGTLHLEQRLHRGDLLRGSQRVLSALYRLRRMQRHGLRRLHVKQSVCSGASVHGWILWTVRREQSVWSERPVHAYPYDVGMHVHGQRRLRRWRGLRCGALRTCLQLEQRLSEWPGMRGGRVRRLHVEWSMRSRCQRDLPIRLVLLFHSGRLSNGARLSAAFSAVWRLPIGS
jgi:hypothetical protein